MSIAAAASSAGVRSSAVRGLTESTCVLHSIEDWRSACARSCRDPITVSVPVQTEPKLVRKVRPGECDAAAPWTKLSEQLTKRLADQLRFPQLTMAEDDRVGGGKIARNRTRSPAAI